MEKPNFKSRNMFGQPILHRTLTLPSKKKVHEFTLRLQQSYEQ